jgi:preprotein translocase subunit SecE
MARDRKRAKQRQRRRAQQPEQSPESPQDEIVHDDREDESDASPDPLAHASGDADIARLAEASVREPGQMDEPLEPEEFPQPDELQDVGEAPARGSRGSDPKPGSELPREGNRLANFLRACVAELRRVQWPDRRHVGQATGVVLGFVVIAGGYLGLLDAVFSRFVEAIL